MPINKIFWFVSFVTVVFLGLLIIGYPVMPAVVALLIINIVVLKVTAESNSHKASMGIVYDLNSKLGSIHSVLLDIGNFLREAPTSKGEASNPAANMVTLGAIEKALGKHKDEIKTEIKNDVDKIAGKIIDVENRLFDMRKGFSAAIAAFDDRLRGLEEGGDETDTATTDEPREYVEI